MRRPHAANAGQRLASTAVVGSPAASARAFCCTRSLFGHYTIQTPLAIGEWCIIWSEIRHSANFWEKVVSLLVGPKLLNNPKQLGDLRLKCIMLRPADAGRSLLCLVQVATPTQMGRGDQGAAAHDRVCKRVERERADGCIFGPKVDLWCGASKLKDGSIVGRVGRQGRLDWRWPGRGANRREGRGSRQEERRWGALRDGDGHIGGPIPTFDPGADGGRPSADACRGADEDVGCLAS